MCIQGIDQLLGLDIIMCLLLNGWKWNVCCNCIHIIDSKKWSCTILKYNICNVTTERWEGVFLFGGGGGN